MNTCDRCGCELDENYYYLSYAHYRKNEEGHFYICPACLFEIKETLNIKKTIKAKYLKRTFDKNVYSISFDLPEGYEIIRGADDEKS